MVFGVWLEVNPVNFAENRYERYANRYISLMFIFQWDIHKKYFSMISQQLEFKHASSFLRQYYFSNVFVEFWIYAMFLLHESIKCQVGEKRVLSG